MQSGTRSDQDSRVDANHDNRAGESSAQHF